MRFRSPQELRAATSRIDAQYGHKWYEDVFEQWIHRHRVCAKNIILKRSKQTVICLEVYTLVSSTTSQNQRRHVPGSH